MAVHHTYPTEMDPYGDYYEGVVTDPDEISERHDTGDTYVRCGDRWANVHRPHANLKGYGVRWWLCQAEIDQLKLG